MNANNSCSSQTETELRNYLDSFKSEREACDFRYKLQQSHKKRNIQMENITHYFCVSEDVSDDEETSKNRGASCPQTEGTLAIYYKNVIFALSCL